MADGSNRRTQIRTERIDQDRGVFMISVAAELAEVALGSVPSGFNRAADLAGPEQLSLAEAVTLMRTKTGKAPPRLITIPAIGGTLRAYETGANLPDPGAKIGGASFREFLLRPRRVRR